MEEYRIDLYEDEDGPVWTVNIIDDRGTTDLNALGDPCRTASECRSWVRELQDLCGFDGAVLDELLNEIDLEDGET